MIRILIAAAFSLLYISLYPFLSARSVIYVYPPWPPPLAVTYILLGILLQGWFSFGRRKNAPRGWLTQMVVGVLYLAAILVFARDVHQS